MCCRRLFKRNNCTDDFFYTLLNILEKLFPGTFAKNATMGNNPQKKTGDAVEKENNCLNNAANKGGNLPIAKSAGVVFSNKKPGRKYAFWAVFNIKNPVQ
jgi:hypothetical protein